MEKQYKFVVAFVNLLDNQFNFFGLRFGFSGLIGLIPGLGDMIDAFLSLYLIAFAIRIHLPFHRILQMLWNILINLVIGAIPIIGDATYIIRRVNIKNLKIINQYVPPTFLENPK